jgi:anti-anti-sigma factor
MSDKFERADSAAEATTQPLPPARPVSAAPFAVRVERGQDRLAIVRVVGELDMLTAPLLNEQVIDLLSSADPVVIDLTLVDFIGSAGLATLVETHEKASLTHVRWALVAARPAILRPLQLTGLSELLTPYPSVAEAVAACQSIQPAG